MSSNKKSLPLVEAMVAATTKEEAIKVLNNVLESLHLTTNYLRLVELKDIMDGYSKEYGEIINSYRELESPISYEELSNIRTNLNFLYRDCSDALSFEIGKLYLYYKEGKTLARGNAMKDLKDNEEFQKDFKTKSLSGLRDVLGMSGVYDSWVTNQAVAYGLWKGLDTLLNAIRMFTDTVSSEAKRELFILQKDVK
jgi:hypothetical protein